MREYRRIRKLLEKGEAEENKKKKRQADTLRREKARVFGQAQMPSVWHDNEEPRQTCSYLSSTNATNKNPQGDRVLLESYAMQLITSAVCSNPTMLS